MMHQWNIKHCLFTIALTGTIAGFCGCKRSDPTPSHPPSLSDESVTGTVGLKQTTKQQEAQEHNAATPEAAEAQHVQAAHASLAPTKGNKVKGEIHLDVDGERVHITGDVSGLSKGEHGFHIHETGDCSGADGKTAGGHFAPAGHPHGDPQGDVLQHHAGDFGNITADGKGVARIDAWSDLPLLTKGADYAIGRAFIVHQGKDDLHSQPSGDAGARVACGVIAEGNSGS